MSIKQNKKDRRAQIKHRKQQQQTRNIIFVTIGAILVVAFLIYQQNQIIVNPATLNQPPSRDYSLASGNALGDPNAPVVIEEFADFQCGACLSFYETTEYLLYDSYIAEGLVYYQVNFINIFQGDESSYAAQAAYCAGDQDMFWQMHDTIFSNFSNGGTGGYSPLRLKAMAENLDLDANDFASCFDSAKYQELVLENGAYGRENGVNSTPSFLINGKLVVGAISFDQLQLEIESALAE